MALAFQPHSVRSFGPQFWAPEVVNFVAYGRKQGRSQCSFHHPNGLIPAIMRGSWRPRVLSVCKAFLDWPAFTADMSSRNGHSILPSCAFMRSHRFWLCGFYSITTWHLESNGFRF